MIGLGYDEQIKRLVGLDEPVSNLQGGGRIGELCVIECRVLCLRGGVDQFELVPALDSLAIDEEIGRFLPDRGLRLIEDELAVLFLHVERPIEIRRGELAKRGSDREQKGE
jgi:hypothetical protein